MTGSKEPVFLFFFKLYHHPPFFGLAFGAKNDTLNSRAKFVAECEPMLNGEIVTSAPKLGLVHEIRQSRADRLFSYRAHQPHGERVHPPGLSAGTELPCSENSNRAPSRGGRNRHVNRWSRRPLARPPARRHSSGQTKNRHFKGPACQWLRRLNTPVVHRLFGISTKPKTKLQCVTPRAYKGTSENPRRPCRFLQAYPGRRWRRQWRCCI
jgi:hypothetical protein